MTPRRASEVDIELGIIPPISRLASALRIQSGDEQEHGQTDVGSVNGSIDSATISQAAHNASRSQSPSTLESANH
jgi:hypothetical protein